MINNKGSFSYFMVFITLAVMLVFLFSIGIPLLTQINTEFYNAGEPMLNAAYANAQDINDATVKAAVLSNIDGQRNSLPDQIEVLSAVSYTHLTLPTTPYV